MFIDLQKAYDNVPLKKLWEVLQETNISHTPIKVKHKNKLSQECQARCISLANDKDVFYGPKVTAGISQLWSSTKYK